MSISQLQIKTGAKVSSDSVSSKQDSKAFSSTLSLDPSTSKILSINQAMDETLVKSPRAASIRFQLGIAKSEIVRATELPNPTCWMDNGYRAEFTYRYGFTVPIEPPWKLAARLLAAKAQVKLTDFQIARDLWNLRADVRRAYTNLIIAQETHSAYNDLYDLANKLFIIADKRYQAGQSARLDVYRAELAANQAEINRDQWKVKIDQARMVLAVILGRQYTNELEVPRLHISKGAEDRVDLMPDFSLAVPELTNLLKQAHENRLELKIIRQSLNLNTANLRVAYSKITPNPIIGFGSSVVNGPPLPPDLGAITLGNFAAAGIYPDPATLPQAPQNPIGKNVFRGFFFQTFMELPIFNFQQGDISQYRATNKQLRAQLSSQENIVDSEIISAYKELQAIREKIKAYEEKILARSERVAQMAKRGYEVGQFDINYVLLAQQDNIAARQQFLDAVYLYENAFTLLEQSVGVPLR